MSAERLTPDQFKEAFKVRGWTGKTLAERWGKSATWISKIANNQNRDVHWDDAIRGLPFRTVPFVAHAAIRNQGAEE